MTWTLPSSSASTSTYRTLKEVYLLASLLCRLAWSGVSAAFRRASDIA